MAAAMAPARIAAFMMAKAGHGLGVSVPPRRGAHAPKAVYGQSQLTGS
jgi:hypothetical protein